MRHVDVLEGRDSLRNPFLGSLALHAGALAFLITTTYLSLGHREQWGDPNSTGGSGISVTPVKSIPVPSRSGLVNRLADDTTTQAPMPPKQEARRATPKEEPDAVELKSKRAKARSKREERPYTARVDKREFEANQVYSRSGQAAVSPLFGTAPGSGGVGVGTGAPFGARFGAYALLIRDRVAQHWRTNEVDSRIHTLPLAIVTFEILRDGSIRNVRLVQSSGNRTLDYSAERAITEAAPFSPLPAAYSGSYATIEFQFQLNR
jgi:protein TonB